MSCTTSLTPHPTSGFLGCGRRAGTPETALCPETGGEKTQKLLKVLKRGKNSKASAWDGPFWEKPAGKRKSTKNGWDGRWGRRERPAPAPSPSGMTQTCPAPLYNAARFPRLRALPLCGRSGSAGPSITNERRRSITESMAEGRGGADTDASIVTAGIGDFCHPRAAGGGWDGRIPGE